MQTILAQKAVGLSELKANPGAAIEAAQLEPVAILNRNKPAGYLISPAQWEAVMAQLERLEDLELLALANTRLHDGNLPVKVRLDEL